MSSSRNSQNLLVNVFRPTYVYDGSSFTTAVVASNVKSIDAETVRAGIISLGDAGGNVYLGKDAGVVYSASASNSNNSAFGVNAASGISNVQNSVFIGSGAGQGLTDAANTVIIGAGASVSGTSNVVIGNNDFVTGSNNFILANDVTLTGSYKVNIGNLITGDVSAKTLAFQTGITVSGDTVTTGKVGIKYPNPTHALDVSGDVYATGKYYAQDGSLNAPTYTFLSDASTGIYRDGSGCIGFTKSGIHAMKLDPSGNVIYNNLLVSGTLTCASFSGAGISSTNLSVPGYIRDYDNIFSMDMSSGRFNFTGTGRSSVAGVVFSDSSINAPNGIVGTGYALSDHLDISHVYYSGQISNLVSTTKNTIGGVVLQSSNMLTGTGTVAAPSHGFSNDASLGLYRVATNTLGFASAGSNRMTIANANVGIGTTTPGSSLTVIGDISATSTIMGSSISTNPASSNTIGSVVLSNTDISYGGKIFGANDTTSNRIGGVILTSGVLQVSNGIAGAPSYSFSNETGLGFYRPSTGVMRFASGGADRMTISNGNVGIGTTAPTTALAVVGDISASGTIGGITLRNSKLLAPAGSVNSPGVCVNDASTGFFKNIGVIIVADGIKTAEFTSNYIQFYTGNLYAGQLSNRQFQMAPYVASEPAYAFSNDPSSGLFYNYNGGQIGLATGGIGRIFVSNSNVGIGTSVPTTALAVIGDISTSGKLTISGGLVSAPAYTFGRDPSAGMYLLGTNQIGFASAGSNRMTISGGFVGIGTTIPTTALAVIGDISYSGAIVGSTDNTSNRIGGVTLNNTSITYGGSISNSSTGFTNSIGGVILYNNNVRTGDGTAAVPSHGFSPDTTMGMYRVGSQALGFAVGSSNRMTICGDRVGIGTVVPTRTLDVSGIIGAQIPITSVGGSSYLMMADISGGTPIQRIGLGIYNPATGSTAGGDFVINTYEDNGAFRNAPFLLKRSNGYVGIGTTAPSSILDVRDATPVLRVCDTVNRTPAIELNRNAGAAFGANTIADWKIQAEVGAIKFIRGWSNSPFTAMSIDGCGNVNVGGAPATTMDISGRTRIISDGSASLTTWGMTADTLTLQHYGSYNTAADARRSASLLFSNSIYPQARIVSEMIGVTPANYGANLIFQTYVFGSTFQERMRIHSNGNVGIGATAPVQSLDISGNLRLFNGGTAAGNGNVANQIVLTNEQDLYATIIRNVQVGDYPDNNRLDFQLCTPTGSISTKMSILGNGKVGIGTLSPQATLDISSAGEALRVNSNVDNVYTNNPLASNVVTIFGPARAAPTITGTTDLNATLFVNSTSAYARNIGASIALGGRGTSFGDGNQHQTWARVNGVQRNDSDSYGGNLVMETNDGNGALRERLRINHNGNVGIGTASPAYALDICGTIRALEGLKQGTNTWGAYSDQRIKQNIELADISTCYSIVKNLPLKRFTWDSSYVPDLKDKNVVGWIAQDVEQVFNKAVSKTPAFGLEDVRILDVDQIYKTMYGALEKVIADKESLELQVSTLQTQLSNVLTRLSNAGL